MKKLFSNKEFMFSIFTILIAICFTIFMYWFANDQKMEFSELSRDTISVLKGKRFTGLYSNVGIMLWGASAVLFCVSCYFTHLYNKGYIGGRAALGFGIVSFLLYTDDFLMIHEQIIKYTLGLPEETMMVFYFVVVIVLIIRYRKLLMKNGLLYVVMSLGFLGLSAGFDTIYKIIYIPQIHIFEDGAKFIGISFWFIFSLTYTQFIFRHEKQRQE